MNYFCIMNVSSASNLLGSPKICIHLNKLISLYMILITFEFTTLNLPKKKKKKKKKSLAHDIFIHVFSNISGLTGD